MLPSIIVYKPKHPLSSSGPGWLEIGCCRAGWLIVFLGTKKRRAPVEAARRRSLKHCERVFDDEANLIQIRLEIGCADSRLAHAEGHVLQCSCLNNLIGFDVALPTLLIGQRIAVLVATHVNLVGVGVVRILPVQVVAHLPGLLLGRVAVDVLDGVIQVDRVDRRR